MPSPMERGNLALFDHEPENPGQTAALKRPAVAAVPARITKRDGTVWNKIRTGWNTYAHRPARGFRIVAGKYDGGEENCKFADVRYTLEEAEALLETVRDYPWARIEPM